MTPDPAFWAGRRVLLTGHTGFKGGWLALRLERLGARVTGLALPPPPGPSLFALAGVERIVEHRVADLRDPEAVRSVVRSARPEIVLHLAAQALVRQSWREPVETFATNVTGAVHLLEALRGGPGLQAVLVVTSDKVYANDESGRAFVEGDALGGRDPYAASKAAAEIVAASYAASFFEPHGVRVATARGGNVVGGGDFADDRIAPDVWRAARAGTDVVLRNPHATRPWQHALDCLDGYLLHAQALCERPEAPRALNFGPDVGAPVTVRDVAETMIATLGARTAIRVEPGSAPQREMASLAVDASLARERLGWRCKLDAREALRWTADWHHAVDGGADARGACLAQIERFEALDQRAKAA